jgi:two-component system sensor histidine kinase KdpD
MSRVEAGAWALNRESIPMSELLGSVLSAFDDQQNSRIIIKNNLGGTSVFVDGVQFEQVLKNLLENALKYSDARANVELECRLVDEALIVDVCDRGIGLPPGEEEKIFQCFYRCQKLDATSGLGIGLSICKGLIEAHGGNILAMRREGGGSIFRVTLPNYKPQATLNG